MRQLNKIAFINSAHIRYAEVAIDGNVHFTGTQGVGKTTLLRAILFFYNCRKDKLGIRTQGQQAFDEFYVPSTSSYIIYEVSRGSEEPPFSVILFRHHNRAAFRFVDASYSKEWIIDSLGTVASDPVTVRQRIQSLGIDCSGIIDRYSQYLDILYGNRSAHLSKDLLKYYLLRSQQYQNIPRIIQNVFLNERVDAGFIKNIIISSVTGEDEGFNVNLDFFRSKLTHFNEELKDISLWTEKNRQGIVETRRDADAIISTSHEIKAANFSLHEQCGMLNYAINKLEREIPILRNRIEKKEAAIQEIKNSIQALTSKFDDEKGKLDRQIGGLEHKLKEASAKKKEYQRIGIEEMIARAATLDGLKLQKKQQEGMLSELTSSHQSISSKYEVLRERIDLAKAQYMQSLKGKENDINSEFNSHQRERMKQKSRIESEIRDRFKTQTAEIDETLNSLRDSLTDQRVQREKIASSSPRKEDIEACQRRISEVETKIRQADESILKGENRREALRNAQETQCREIEHETDLKIKDIESKKTQLGVRRQEELDLLSKAKGSLCEWLDNNLEGWEKSIGKIADEKKVLYSTTLSPQLVAGNHDNIFGIRLDLDGIEKDVRTPSMIKESVNSLDKEIEALTNDIIKLREESKTRMAQVTKELSNQIKSVQSEIDRNIQKRQTAQIQYNEEFLKLNTIKEEEKEHLEEIIKTLDHDIQKLQLQINQLSEQQKNIVNTYETEVRKVHKKLSSEEKLAKAQRDNSLAQVSQEKEAYLKEYASTLQHLEEDEASELSNSGADTLMLKRTKEELDTIYAAIDRIESERDRLAEYRKDCRELLDRVPQMQTDRMQLEAKLSNLRQKYDDRHNKLSLKQQDEEHTIATLRFSHSQATEAKHQADEFIASKVCPPELEKAGTISTELDCSSLIHCIQDLVVDIQRLSVKLREDTNEFQKRFSPNNLFKFPTIFATIEDYHQYADSLEEFIAHNKIKDYQQWTSNLYRDILSQVARDYNLLLGRESEILKLIKAINHDFEKKTFAGVIRSIELRLERNAMPIITQLQNITDFWNAHQYELGEVNLFSTDEQMDINKESIKYIETLTIALYKSPELKKLPLEQTFALKFKIQENDNVTDWVENIRAIGSEGTDILVKAIINILLISVFKNRAGQGGDFRLHCMMDEIGRLADENIQGILNFANQRGIFIVNSSPKAHRPLSYRRLYMLSKDNKANTTVQPILSTREAELL